MKSEIKTGLQWKLSAFVVACILVLHSPLIFNPGYLSHDELQWNYMATQYPGWDFVWSIWRDVHAFQYRPLTFMLWMWVSRHCFDHPFIFHAIIVTASAFNGALLSLVLRYTSADFRSAALGGAVVWIRTLRCLYAWLGCDYC